MMHLLYISQTNGYEFCSMVEKLVGDNVVDIRLAFLCLVLSINFIVHTFADKIIDMFIVFGIMLLGVLIGYLLRQIPNITFIAKLISLFIFLLLFSLGISVGKNQEILNNLSTIGLQALVIAVGAMAGSICLTGLIYNKYFKKDEKR